MTPPGLQLADVTVRYGARVAVRGVDLDVAPGTLTALLGPSGSGKTTLLHTIDRLLELNPSAHVSGRVLVAGVDVRTLDADTLRRRVGLILQRPTPFPMSIRENVAFPLRAHGTPRTEIPDRVERALRRAAVWGEVEDRLDRSPLELSGGQQQRLCLARALALEPGVLLLDEPCGSLDPSATAAVEGALRSLIGSTTMVLVTHNLAQARRLASRCLCLWAAGGPGERVDEGPTERVFEAAAHPELAAWFSGAIG